MIHPINFNDRLIAFMSQRSSNSNSNITLYNSSTLQDVIFLISRSSTTITINPPALAYSDIHRVA